MSKSCVLFSTADWDSRYWTNKQHNAVALSNAGYKVLYVESVGLRTPMLGSSRDLSRLFKRFFRGLRHLFFGPKLVQKNIFVVSPLAIPFWHHKYLVKIFNQQLLAYQIKSFLKAKKYLKPLIWTYHPYILRLVSDIDYHKIVYHCVDDLSTVPRVDGAAYKIAEEDLLRHSDIVFATTLALQKHCSDINPNSYYFSNVVDLNHFCLAFKKKQLPDDLRNVLEPRILYHGSLSDFKIDFQLLLEVSKRKSEFSFILIGDEPEGQNSSYIKELKKLRNVHFLGYKAYEDLPKYMSGCVVGILPSLLNDYTRSMFPMKFFEYISAGLRVVSTPLAFTKNRYEGLLVASSAEEFVESLETQMSLPALGSDKAAAIIGSNTWSERMDAMIRLIDAN